MIKKIAEKLEGYDPKKHKIAIYTSSHHVAQRLATQLQLTRREWFYVDSVQRIFGMRDLYLLFYGDFLHREDFDQIWNYWETFMPSDCHHYLLEQELEEV